MADLKRSMFARVRLPDIEPRLTDDLIKDMLPIDGVAIAAGPSGTGKTFCVMELSLRISRGELVSGRMVTAGGVVYVAAEDPEGAKRRIKAWRIRYGDDGAFELIERAPNIRNPSNLSELRCELMAAKAEFAACGVTLRLVVLDTVAKAAPGADQNSSADMGEAMAALAMLARDLGCLILVIAHTPKDEGRGIAGWYGQFAGADAVIMFSGDGVDDPIRVATVTKMRNGPVGRKLAYQLEVVEVGRTETGAAVTSCIVVFEDPPASRKPRATLRAPEQIVLRALNQVIDGGECEPAPGAGRGTLAARRAVVAEHAKAIGFWNDGEKSNTCTKRLGRTIESLAARKVIRVVDELIWPV